MGFFSRWFKGDDGVSSQPSSRLSSRLSSELEHAPDPVTDIGLDAKTASQVLAEIDIDRAIESHENWKVRLRKVLEGHSDEQFDLEVVRRDDCCALGQWLHGPGQRRLGKYPAFTVLVARHQYFHTQASAVLEHVQTGRNAMAEQVFNSAYRHGSNQVILLLKELKRGLGG